VSLTINGGTDNDIQTDFIHILPDKSPPYSGVDGGDFERHVLDYAAETLSGTPFERGTSNIAGKQGTFNGRSAWVTGLSQNNYSDQTDTRLYTPNFDFSTLAVYTLRFRSRFYTEASYDGFRVEYSLDKGDSWAPLGANGIQANWYNFANTNRPTAFPAGEAFFAGNRSNAFNEYYYDVTSLTGNPNVAFRFRFRTDQYVTAPGVAIDNFEIDNYLLSAFILDFQGEWKNGGAELAWLASTDGSPTAFELERSKTGNDFRSIVRIPFIPNNGEHIYEFRDEDAEAGINYYRLRWQNIDGAVAFSDHIVAITKPLNGFSIYPNPVQDQLNLQLDFAANISLINMNGQVMLTKQLETGKHQVDMSQFAAGTYIIELLNREGERFTQKLIVR